MEYQHAEILKGEQIVAENLNVKLDFRSASISVTGSPCDWHGSILAPNNFKLPTGTLCTLKLKGFSSCSIKVGSRNAVDQVVEFEGIGAPPIGLNQAEPPSNS